MEFVFFLPHARLRPYIRRYAFYRAELGDIPQSFKCLPTGKTYIICNLGSPFRIYNPMHLGGIMQDGSMVVGHQDQCYIVEPTGCYKQFTILLNPSGIYRLYGISLYPLLNNGGPLTEVLGDELRNFPAALENFTVDKASAFIKEIERYFLSRVPVHVDYPYVERAVEHIFSTSGNCTVASLAENAGVSLRHLRRVFKNVCGISPKGLIRITRFQYIVSTFKNEDQRKIDWCEIALSHGYYDQMHFIRDFKAFTGETPTSYLSRVRKAEHQFEKKFLAPDF